MKLLLENLTRRYPRQEHPALDNACLSVAAGEILCVAGESGSGKSTLLRLIAGLDAPDAGRILCDGRVLTDGARCLPPEQRFIGMVFQDYALFPHLTVARNIAFGLQRLPRRQRRQRVDAMLALIRLGDYANRYPHELSGGQCQRVALARALAPEPALLLLDEAFCNLDRRLRADMLEDIRGLLRETGTTALSVTHDLADALILGDRLAILHRGRLLQAGTPRELYEQPADEYVAHCFGEANLAAAILDPAGLHTDFGTLPRPAHPIGSRDVLLCIRPHALRLVEPGKGTCASVAWVRFHGHCQEVGVRLVHGEQREYRVHVAKDLPVAVGDRVHLHPEHSQIAILAR